MSPPQTSACWLHRFLFFFFISCILSLLFRIKYNSLQFANIIHKKEEKTKLAAAYCNHKYAVPERKPIASQYAVHAERNIVLPILSACPSNAGIVDKEWTYRYSFFKDPVSHHSSFWAPPLLQNSNRNPVSGALNSLHGGQGWGKIAIFHENRRLSRKRYEIGPWLLYGGL